MKTPTPSWLAILSSLAIVAIYIFSEYDNLSWRLAWVTGLCTIPFVLRLNTGDRSYRYLWPALFLMVGLIFIRSSTIFYFACSMLLLFIWEFNWGKKSILVFFLLAICSPFVGNMAYVWSFPIRLQLSQWATDSLRMIGFDAQSAGNIILLNGQEFAVDPACMGLQMLITSLVLAIFIMARSAYQRQQQYSFLTITGSLLIVLILAIGANFMRLLALIIFRISPTNPLHDIVGLLSLALYALLPFYGGWSWWSTRQGATIKKEVQLPTPGLWVYGIQLTVVVFLALVGLQFRQPATAKALDLSELNTTGYQSQIKELGVLQLDNANALVYIKPPVRAFQGGHDPRICWQGSGYEFTKIDTLHLLDYTIYQAILVKNSDTLYTAWWYDDGTTKTINEWHWRWATLYQKSQFRLLNVSTDNEENLRKLASTWLQK